MDIFFNDCRFLGIQYSYKKSQLVVWRKFEVDKGYPHPFLVLKGKKHFYFEEKLRGIRNDAGENMKGPD